VSQQKVDASALDAAPLADADCREHRHEHNCHRDHDDEDGLHNARLCHHPARTQEDDHSEDVDEARGEDAVPRAEQNRLRDEELRLPPWLVALQKFFQTN